MPSRIKPASTAKRLKPNLLGTGAAARAGEKAQTRNDRNKTALELAKQGIGVKKAK